MNLFPCIYHRWQTFSCHGHRWDRLICKHSTVCYFTQPRYHTAGMQMPALFLEKGVRKIRDFLIPPSCITTIQRQSFFFSSRAVCIWTVRVRCEGRRVKVKKKSNQIKANVSLLVDRGVELPSLSCMLMILHSTCLCHVSPTYARITTCTIRACLS